ncbi:hypothetical protein DM828_15935 [Pseudomonas umsongensis]|nr:hypothetical protein [Pseudomonas umsongensis]
MGDSSLIETWPFTLQRIQHGKTPCRSEHAPGGVPTKNLGTPRGFRRPALSLTSIASMLAPTGTSPDAH